MRGKCQREGERGGKESVKMRKRGKDGDGGREAELESLLS